MLFFGSFITKIVKTFKVKHFPNEKVCVWICLTLQSLMTRSALTISFLSILCLTLQKFWCNWSLSTDFFSAYSGRAVYVWLCRDFDIHTEQCSAVQLSDTFRQVCSAEQGQIFSLELWVWKIKKLLVIDIYSFLHPLSGQNLQIKSQRQTWLQSWLLRLHV
jgi:hypothetical protein